MKTNAFLLLIAIISCSALGWVIWPGALAQPPSDGSAPKPSAESSKPASDEQGAQNATNDELRTLILLLTERIKPSPNAMPNGMKNGFVEDEKLILKLASEVLVLRERVDKLERRSKEAEPLK